MNDPSKHPSGPQLLAFLLASDEPEESARMREHLLSGCVHCLRKLHQRADAARRQEKGAVQGAWQGWSREGMGEGGDHLIALADRRALVVEAERAAAPGLLRELLLAGAPEERLEVVRTRKRFRFLGLAELLTEEARRAVFEDLAQAVELGRLAREVADSLERHLYPPGLVVDTLALAWGALGNAYRAQGNLAEAERALETAEGLIPHGSRDALVKGDILSLLGSLRTDQARFGEAVKVLEQAARIHRSVGHEPEEGKILVKLGNAAGEGGDPERAARYLEAAWARLGDGAPGELRLMAGQTLVEWLRAAGRLEEARGAWARLHEETSGRVLSFFLTQRLAWAGARLAWSEGELERAAEELRLVREGYAEREEDYDSCLVTLDLAMLCLEQGRTGEVRRLAEEMVPVFASRQIHHHAAQALVVFQRAAEAETATVALLQSVARFMRHAANNRYLEYQPATEA